MRDDLQTYAEKMEPRATGVISSDVIDSGGASDYGKTPEGNFLQVQVTEEFASGGAASLKVSLAHSDDNISYENTTLVTTDIAKADLVAGKKVLCQPLPVGFKRYSKVTAEVKTAAFTAGSISAWIGHRQEG
jgi:hypothetical protein